MKYVFAAVAILLVSPAFAQDSTLGRLQTDEDWHKQGVKIHEATRHVISGKSIILYFEHALDSNCTQGEFDARILKYPEHGTIELVPATGRANFPKENIRSKCNGQKVKGINIIYKSSPKYAGPDTAYVMTFAESGFAVETRWKLNVVR